jgi:hypothetical protein
MAYKTKQVISVDLESTRDINTRPRTIFKAKKSNNLKVADKICTNSQNNDIIKDLDQPNSCNMYHTLYCEHFKLVLRFCVLFSKEILKFMFSALLKNDNEIISNGTNISLEINGQKTSIDTIYKPTTSPFIDYVVEHILKPDDITWLLTNKLRINKDVIKIFDGEDDINFNNTIETVHNNDSQTSLREKEQSKIKSKNIFDLTISEIVMNINDRDFTFSAMEALRGFIKKNSTHCDMCRDNTMCIENTFINAKSGVLKVPNINTVRKIDYYVFLMIHLIPDKKNEAWIGISTNPLKSVNLINIELIQSTKGIRPALPWWMPEMIIGPTDSLKHAVEIAREWYDHTRGFKSRREKGIDLARKWNLKLYDKNEDRKQNLDHLNIIFIIR